MKKREIILDTETTGLYPADGHRIVEIGAVEMVNKVLTGNEFQVYINPERDMPTQAFRVHNLSEKFLSTKPVFSEIVDQFLEFIDDSDLVIHNARFDVNFLNSELGRLDKNMIDLSSTIDTLKIARQKFPGKRVNLDALCKRFKINNNTREYHGALIDARILAEIYVELTGGRQENFLLKNHSDLLEDEKLNKQNVGSVDNKIIVKPSSEELVNYQKFMKKINR